MSQCSRTRVQCECDCLRLNASHTTIHCYCLARDLPHLACLRPHSVQLCESVYFICTKDFPERWPSLMPQLAASVRLEGGLHRAGEYAWWRSMSLPLDLVLRASIFPCCATLFHSLPSPAHSSRPTIFFECMDPYASCIKFSNVIDTNKTTSSKRRLPWLQKCTHAPDTRRWCPISVIIPTR